MIRTEGLSYSYNSQKKISFRDVTIGQSERWLLLGDSGCGKTTLLHLLGGLLKAGDGSIVINDTNITTLSETGLDKFRGKHIGFVFQKNHLISALSVELNLLMAPFLAGLPQNRKLVSDVLTELDLKEEAGARIKELSHGQAQRVAIARAVINQPSVILADEPTSALDDKNCERVIDLLLKVSERHKTTLVVATHDQRLKSKFKHAVQL